MKTSDFDYSLPEEYIAQSPIEPRDHSRLMVLRRSNGSSEHRRFFELTDYLREGDMLVFNDSRVFPARLTGRRAGTGGKVEVLLLQRTGPGVWEGLVRGSKRLGEGSKIYLGDGHDDVIEAEVLAVKPEGIRVMRFQDESQLPLLGRAPLPPYIHQPLEDPARYQTVYARVTGSAAAPTAGLHFTERLLGDIEQKGVQCLFLTLHIGLDTFAPVREEDPAEHVIHREFGTVGREVAEQLSRGKREGRRIICVGTTTVRILEHAASTSDPQQLDPFSGWVDLFILPGHRFKMVDAMVTNFHLPRSTLLMLVSAFTGQEMVHKAYMEAISCGYRFYSFGDAMLVL